jgi:flagellar hook-basal body complex protein FliE
VVGSVSSALNAYQAALSRINSAQTSQPQVVSKPEQSFGQVLQNVVEEAVDTQKIAEATTIKGITGQADIQDVVLAISNAEQALETVVAVRDTAIKAYNSIMQMNI